MADADVPITAGTGTKIDTRTVGAGTDEHRQVIVVGDPATAANVATVSAAGALKVDGSAVTQPVSFASVPTVAEKQDQPASSTATWTSATAINTALTNTAVTGYGTANVSIQVPSTVTGGVITLEISDDGTVWYPAGAVRVDNGWQENVVTLALTPGIALNRMYAVSVDAMTHIRARLSTVIAGTGNVIVRIGLVAGGIEPFVATRPRKVATYRAAYRSATVGAPALGVVFAGSTRKQVATIHHAVSATKTVRIRSALINVQKSTAAVNFWVSLARITSAPATGNPAITPAVADSADAAAEATCLAMPTTGGTEGAIYGGEIFYPMGVTGAVPTTNPPPASVQYDLLASIAADDERKLPTIRAGVLEGWAVVGVADGASTINMQVSIEFTEEAP